MDTSGGPQAALLTVPSRELDKERPHCPRAPARRAESRFYEHAKVAVNTTPLAGLDPASIVGSHRMASNRRSATRTTLPEFIELDPSRASHPSTSTTSPGSSESFLQPRR